MSAQTYSEQQIEALRIGNSSRNHCLKYLVPYRKCTAQHNYYAQLMHDECAQLRRDYLICQRPIELRETGMGAMMLKKNDHAKFVKDEIAPNLKRNFNPSPLDFSKH